MYACQLLLLQLLIWAIIAEAICCCLQLGCNVNNVLAFIVTSDDKSQFFVYLCYLLIIILPEAICCSETLNVYVVLLMLFCIIM